MTAKSEDKQPIQADPRLVHAYPYFRVHLEEIRACIECGCSIRSVWRTYATRAAHPFPGSYSSFLRYCNAHALGRRRAKEGTQSDLNHRGQALPTQRPNETPSKRGPLRGPKPLGVSVLGRLKLYPPPLDRPPGPTPEQIERMMDADLELDTKATLSSIYSFGVFEELVETNVCRAVPKDNLPKRGKPRRKVYTDVEAPLLMHHARDDQPEWRIFYCLQGLAGMRPGAAAGRRWSDLDWNTPVLPSLRVWSKYQDLPLKTSKGDDTKERTVPVHPDLGRVLRRWKLQGFAQRYGRPPRPDDFICPDARTMQALTPGRTSKAPDTDCPAVGIPDKGNHALRRFFITYARRGGARKDMLERVTHNASGDILDVYTDPDGI